MKNFSCQRRLNARFYALAALTLALSGCGGGSHAPRTTPTSTGAAQIARWKPVVSGDAPAPSAPPTAGSATEQSEIAQLLALQSARAGAQITAFNAWNGHVAARFNALARALVISHDTVPPLASRVYAALGVAQFDAVIAANRQRTRFSRATPAQTDARLTPLSSQSDGYPSPESALCAASADVLKSLYPDSAAQIDKARDDCQQSRLIGGVAFPSDVEAGADIGDSIAAKILARIATDNSDQAARNLPQPSGPGYWKGTGGLLPSWKFVKPWLTTDITPFRAPAPPAFDSVAFQTDLAEVRQISDNRSATQSQIADFWADAAQTFTPPGHWNLFAEKMVESHNLSDAQSARVFALLGMASQDAGISCWDAKFTYWVIRPSQDDPQITTPVGLPNFPSYTSGHSSFSGAAAQILGALFPDEKSTVDALAQEASISRVYGGIHYRFDANGGLAAGRKVADLAVARGRNDGSNLPAPTGTTLSFDQLKAATQAELNRVAPGKKNAANWD